MNKRRFLTTFQSHYDRVTDSIQSQEWYFPKTATADGYEFQALHDLEIHTWIRIAKVHHTLWSAFCLQWVAISWAATVGKE